MLGFITKLEECLDKIHNYLFYEPPCVTVIYKRKTYNHHNIYKDSYCNQIIEKENIIKELKKKHKKKFDGVLSDINEKNHIIFYIYKLNLKDLINYKLVILNFKIVYNDEKKIFNFKYFNNISKYLHNNKIILFIVSEYNPKYFPELKYFNKNNLITPYHYRRKTFGGVTRIGLNTFSDKSVEVNFNQILIDIKNQYGLNDNELIYINSEKIENVNTKLLE